MVIKCNECNGVMQKAEIVDPTVTRWGNFGKRRYSGHSIKVRGKIYPMSNMTHLDDEIIVVCSNFPECHNYYVMKKYNFDERNKDKKVGSTKISGYGTHYYRR